MALESFPPLALIAIRFTLSGSLMLAVVGWRGSLFPRGRDLRNACISGVLILESAMAPWYSRNCASPVGWPDCSSPSPLLAGGYRSAAARRRAPALPTVFGMLVGLCGAALLVAPEVLGHTVSRNTLAGFLILQLGMSTWSLGSIFQKRQELKAHPIVVERFINWPPVWLSSRWLC